MIPTRPGLYWVTTPGGFKHLVKVFGQNGHLAFRLPGDVMPFQVRFTTDSGWSWRERDTSQIKASWDSFFKEKSSG